MDNHIVCPNCKKNIKLTEALSHQLVDFKKKIQREHEELKKTLEEERRDILEEKKVLWQKAQAAAAKQAKEKESEEMKLLKERLDRQNKKIEEAQKIEIELRRERVKLEEEKKEQALKVQRTLDSERKKIVEDTYKKAAEERHLKEAEREEQLRQARRKIEELQQRLEQGSQQIQGEAFEIELEKLLRAEYPYDEIREVGKGMRGADLLQTVRDKTGKTCGAIIWESKRTKAFSREWIVKLKEDQRRVGAKFAVLVSIILPDGVKNAVQKDGVWVTNYDSILVVASLLRRSLIEVEAVKKSQGGQKEKMEVLYNYLISVEFAHRIEAIIESFSAMQEDMEQEKRFMNKKWAKQERSIRKVIDNTYGMHGDLQAIVGKELGEVKGLEELPSGEDKNTDTLF